MTLLALAHGAKGIEFMWFDSYFQNQDNGSCIGTYWEAIVDENANPLNLYPVIKDDLVPRLKGTLGNTLLDLDYTGNYINIEYREGPPPENNTYNYLTINHYGMSYFWHAGLFNKRNLPDNKYFMLANLRLHAAIASLTISNSTGFSNLSFTDVEGGVSRVDTTIGFNTSITYLDSLPEGEGRLYHVAPVIKYGGKLIYNEIISSTTTLLDEMVIQNGATLTVNSTYNADRDIRIKAGGRITTTNGGTLKFYTGHKLIIEGAATLSGTSQHRLILDFISSENGNGIVIDSLGALTIYYCDIKNAQTGILAKVSSKSFDIQNCIFLDCENESINILGQTPYSIGSQRKIKYNRIENSNYGISAANLSEILIQQDSIKNTDLGIFLSDITNAQIISNKINSNSNELEGILEVSCGGVTRGNTISGHTVGLRLANSSIDCGGNLITDCLYHAMFIGDGSNPNMRGRLAGNPPKAYPISGYNHFENNGGYDGGPEDNDGSEIFFKNSNATIRDGCNSTIDDREPQGELRNTLLLMNCPGGGLPIEIRAENNYWGETIISPERFGNLNVNYNPYYSTPCTYRRLVDY